MLVAIISAFLASAVVNYLQLAERAAWLYGSRLAGYILDGLGDAAIVVTVILVATYSWPMLPASVLGTVAGRRLAELHDAFTSR